MAVRPRGRIGRRRSLPVSRRRAADQLHFVDVTLTLIGLLVLRPGFRGEARRWWTAAIVVGIWHLFEHSLLLGQALTGTTLWGAAQPTSVLQLIVPRIELHLVYNAVVLAVIVTALAYQHQGSGGLGARRGWTAC